MSWQRPINSLLSCSSFFCCSLNIEKADTNGPSSGSCSWIDILEDNLFSWSLCTDYWMFHLLSLFTLLTFRVYDPEYSYSFDYSLLLCPSYFLPTSFCSFGDFFSELQIVYFPLDRFFCGFCLLVYFRKVLRTLYLDIFLYIFISSQLIYSLIIPYHYCFL